MISQAKMNEILAGASDTEKEMFNILWDVARMELCTAAHKKNAECIVLVTPTDMLAVVKALLVDSNFKGLVKRLP
jgi:hypothetical protein